MDAAKSSRFDAKITRAMPGGVRLTLVRGPNAPRDYPVLQSPISLGRKRADIVVVDPEISSNHAEIVQQESQWVIRDLGSTNGTWVNGKRIQEETLKSGDEILLGTSVFKWEAAPRPAVVSPVPIHEPRSEGKRIPLGIYDNFPDFRGLNAMVSEESLPLLEDGGTTLFDLTGTGIELKLPPHAQVQLEIAGGPEKGRVVNLTGGNVVIGRYGTDVVLKDADISRRHVTLEMYGRDQIFVRDLNSTNGTWVNGVRERFCKLQSGDTVVIGHSVIQLFVKDIN